MIEICFFIEYIENNEENGVELFKEYIEYKEKIFKDNFEFNNNEKLMILIDLYSLVINYDNYNFVRLYDLPKSSPFIASEKLFLDIVQELKEDSGLYFFYLQINSKSGMDYYTLNTWYKIKYIPLIEIKSHLLYSFQFFFFTINHKNNKLGGYTNPQTLLKTYNISKIVGYSYKKDFLKEKNMNNSVKLSFVKFHENSHSKFLEIEFEPRYLYNNELKILDTHYDSIIKTKVKKDDFKHRGIDVGEVGYAFEIFIFDDYHKTDLLLNSLDDLTDFYNSKLYSGNNFKDLNALFIKIIKNYKRPINKTSKKKLKQFIVEEKNIVKSKNYNDNNDENDNNDCTKKGKMFHFRYGEEIGKY